MDSSGCDLLCGRLTIHGPRLTRTRWRLWDQGFVLRLVGVEFHRSARKHGVSGESVVHALACALVEFDLGDDDSPTRRLVLGPDLAGNLLEVVVLRFDHDQEMVIHAMAMRPKYRILIEGLSKGPNDG